MKPVTMLAVLISAVGPAAMADTIHSGSANENKPPIVTVMTPENWTHQTLPNGAQYQPLPAAQQGRPGNVNCNVMTQPDAELRAWSQDTIDHNLARLALRLVVAQGSDQSAVITPVSQEPIEVSGHNAFLILSKGLFSFQNVPPFRARLATMLFAVPGWEYVATCTVADRTEDGAEAAWNAWKPTLLAIIKSLSVHY